MVAKTHSGYTRIGLVRVSGENSVSVDNYVEHDPAVTDGYRVASYGYDDDGRPVYEGVPDGHRSWAYDKGRVVQFTSVTAGSTPSMTYAYDAAGDVVSTRFAGSGYSTDYTYDSAGQLTSVGGVTPATYTYDALGRRETSTAGASTTGYTYNSRSELTSTTTGSSGVLFGYDPAGRRTSETSSDGSSVGYGYDPAGRLASYTRTNPDGTGVVHQRGYDTAGRLTRVSNTDTPDGVSSVSRVDWDDSPVPQVTGWQTDGSTLTFVNSPAGPSVVKAGSANTAIANDYLGPVYPSGLNQNSQPAKVYATKTRYTPFGIPRTQVPAAQMSMQPAFGYRGELTFGPLTHLRARDYDPITGVFTTPDPLSDVPGTPTIGNPYHYTNNNPLNRTDPTGMRTTDATLTGHCPAGLVQGSTPPSTHDAMDGDSTGSPSCFPTKSLWQYKLDLDELVLKYLESPAGMATSYFFASGPTARQNAISGLNCELASFKRTNEKVWGIDGHCTAITIEVIAAILALKTPARTPRAAGLRAGRQSYVDSARLIADDGLSRIAAGEAPEAVAREAVAARNALKATAREPIPGPVRRWMEWRNWREYGDPLGPSYDDLANIRRKTPEQIIAGAGRTSTWINRILGAT